jgi:hypothetical protein
MLVAEVAVRMCLLVLAVLALTVQVVVAQLIVAVVVKVQQLTQALPLQKLVVLV